jgi:hypothetical protein
MTTDVLNALQFWMLDNVIKAHDDHQSAYKRIDDSIL